MCSSACKRARIVVNDDEVMIAGGGTFATLTVTGTSDLQGAVTCGSTLEAVNNITSTSGNIVSQAGTVSASGNVSSASGNIFTSGGTLSSTGNITTSAGNIIATLGDMDAPAGDISATAGTITGLNVTATSTVSGFIVNSTTAMNTGSLASTGAISGTTITGTALTATTGTVSATLGDIVADAGDLNATLGDVNALVGQVNALTAQTSGNITTTGGDFIATTGDVTVTAGDVTVVAGDVDVTAGGVTAAAGLVTALNVTATNDMACDQLNMSGTAEINGVQNVDYIAGSTNGPRDVTSIRFRVQNSIVSDLSNIVLEDGTTNYSGLHGFSYQVTGAPFRDIPPYSQDTWTPVLGDPSGDFTMVIQSGTWVRVGNMIWANCDCSYSNQGSAGAANLILQGLPFIASGVNWGVLHSMDITGAVNVNEVMRVRNDGTTQNWNFVKSNLATGVETLQTRSSLETGTDNFRFSVTFLTTSPWRTS